VITITNELRQQVATQARYRCGYCLTLEIVSGIPLVLEHIIPPIKGGRNVEENLWLACYLCSEAKAILTEVVDPKSGLVVPLFNPRTQLWISHFAWSEDGRRVIRQSDIGRATVQALDLNNEWRVLLRSIWTRF